MKKRMIFIYSFISFLCLSTITNVFALEGFQDFGLKQNVEPNKEWTIKFNKLINDDSVSNDNIYIEDDAGRKIKSTLKVLNNSVIVKPCVDYERGKTYCLFVNKKIKSRNKKIIKKPVKMLFKIKEAKKNNIVIKNNEVSVNSDSDISEAIDLAIEKRIKSLKIDFTNYKDDNKKGFENAFSYLKEELSPNETYFIIYGAEGNTLCLNIEYPYFMDNSYEQDNYSYNDCKVKVMYDKRFIRTQELGKIKVLAPKEAKIEFKSENAEIADVDKNGNVIPKKQGRTKINVKVEVISPIRGILANENFEVPVNVIGNDAVYINKLQDISEVIEKNVGSGRVNIFINNSSLKPSDMKKEQKKAEAKINSKLGKKNRLRIEINYDFTSIDYMDYFTNEIVKVPDTPRKK